MLQLPGLLLTAAGRPAGDAAAGNDPVHWYSRDRLGEDCVGCSGQQGSNTLHDTLHLFDFDAAAPCTHGVCMPDDGVESLHFFAHGGDVRRLRDARRERADRHGTVMHPLLGRLFRINSDDQVGSLLELFGFESLEFRLGLLNLLVEGVDSLGRLFEGCLR